MTQSRLIDRSMIVGIYGQARRKHDINREDLNSEIFRHFDERALLLGWTRSGAEGLSDGLWEMNDADFYQIGEYGLISWVQVGLPAREKKTALPIVPLIDNAWVATGRSLIADFGAVQVLLPLQEAGPASRYLHSGQTWFARASGSHTTKAVATIDTGDDAVASDSREHILACIKGLNLDHFGFAERDSGPALPVPETPIFGDLRLGSSRHQAAFHVDLPGWTPEVASWAVMIVAEGARLAGVRTSASIIVAPSPLKDESEGLGNVRGE